MHVNLWRKTNETVKEKFKTTYNYVHNFFNCSKIVNVIRIPKKGLRHQNDWENLLKQNLNWTLTYAHKHIISPFWFSISVRERDAHQIFYFLPYVSQPPCHWGRPPDYFQKRQGSCDAGHFLPQAVKSLCGIPRFLLACHGVWQRLEGWASGILGLGVSTWIRAPHPDIAKQTYVELKLR